MKKKGSALGVGAQSLPWGGGNGGVGPLAQGLPDRGGMCILSHNQWGSDGRPGAARQGTELWQMGCVFVGTRKRAQGKVTSGARE